MNDNRVLIENLARTLPKIAVCSVWNVCNAQEPNKTNALVIEESTIDSVFENVWNVWNGGDDNKFTDCQTIQTKNKTENVCDVLDEEFSKTAEFKVKKGFQTFQTIQTDENDNTHKKNSTTYETFPPIPSNAPDSNVYTEIYEERAAIIQYDASDVVHSREQAEQLAMEDMRKNGWG